MVLDSFVIVGTSTINHESFFLAVTGHTCKMALNSPKSKLPTDWKQSVKVKYEL